MRWVFVLGLALLLIGAAEAACPVTVAAQSTSQFLADLPALRSDVQTCQPALRAPISLLGDATIAFDVSTGFTATIQGGAWTDLQAGTASSPSHTVRMDECVLDAILSSNDRLGAFAYAYKQGDIHVSAHGFWNNVKFAAARPLIGFGLGRAQVATTMCQGAGQAAQGPVGKPDNCHGTYLPGFEAYQYAKDEWDRRSAETDGVCQVPALAGPPRPDTCVYKHEIVKGGQSSWVCWYNEK